MKTLGRIFSIMTAAAILFTGCAAVNPENEENKILQTEDINAETPADADNDNQNNDNQNNENDEPEENGEVPIYDNSAVIEAYRSEDPSGLDEKDRAVYDEAVRVLPEFYSEGMTDEEIVIAAHDWIVTNLVYDEGEMLAIPVKTPDTENPYGALILRQGICMGYTTLFQLFMDMLGVESIIVRGDGYGKDRWEEHAWNMVKINGNYYHVDTTWDDFIPDEEGRMPFHLYTLVPDCAMDAYHRWDHDKYPSATSDDLIYYKTHGLYMKDKSDVAKAQEEACNADGRYVEVMTDKSLITFDGGATAYWELDFDSYFVTVYWLYPLG